MKWMKHAAFVLACLFVTLGIPLLIYSPNLFSRGLDAVSSASLEIPDQPSGEFLVLINKDRHPDTLKEWDDFFSERPVSVIMEDISCLVAEGDTGGVEAARRYQARLAANQMRLSGESYSLLVSKAENGLFDVIILSAEMEKLSNYSAVLVRDDVYAVRVISAQ